MANRDDLTPLVGSVRTIVEETINGVNASLAAEAGDDSDLASLAQAISEVLMEQFGISKDAIMPAILKDLVRQVELVETLVVRVETSAKDIKSR